MGLPLTPQTFNSEFTPEKWWLEDVCLSYCVSVTFQRLCSTSGGEMIVLFFCFFLSSFFPGNFCVFQSMMIDLETHAAKESRTLWIRLYDNFRKN